MKVLGHPDTSDEQTKLIEEITWQLDEWGANGRKGCVIAQVWKHTSTVVLFDPDETEEFAALTQRFLDRAKKCD